MKGSFSSSEGLGPVLLIPEKEKVILPFLTSIQYFITDWLTKKTAVLTVKVPAAILGDFLQRRSMLCCFRCMFPGGGDMFSQFTLQ